MGYQNYNDFKYNIISKLKNSDEESQINVHEEALSVLNKVEKMQKEAMNDLNNENLTTLTSLENVLSIEKKEQWIEVFLSHEIDNQSLLNYCQEQGIHVLKIDE